MPILNNEKGLALARELADAFGTKVFVEQHNVRRRVAYMPIGKFTKVK